MARTYQPTLRELLHVIAIFVARWRVKILAGMTSEQAAALTAFEMALIALQESLGDQPVNP